MLLYSMLDGPKTALTYFFTSRAMSTKPVSWVYNVLSRVFRDLVTSACATGTALLLAIRLSFSLLMLLVSDRIRWAYSWLLIRGWPLSLENAVFADCRNVGLH